MDLSNSFSKIKYCYICFYIIFVFLCLFVPYQVITAEKDSFVYTFLGVFGVFLLLADLFYKQNMFKIQHVDLLVLFYIACLFSVIVNHEYSFFSNLKGIMWMCIQTFLFCAVDDELSNHNSLRGLSILADIFIAIFFIGAVWSVCQFLVQYGASVDVFYDGVWKSRFQGYIDSRLFGVFIDPNYGGVCGLIAIFFAAFNLVRRKRLLFVRIFYIISIFLAFIYIVASGSRTCLLAIAVTFAILGGLFIALRIKSSNKFLKIVIFVVSGLCCAFFSLGICSVSKTAISYLPAGYSYCEKLLIETVDNSEDNANDNSRINNSVVPQANLIRNDVANTDDISNTRFTIWSECLQIIKSTPIFGTSPRAYLAYAEDHFDDLYIVEKQFSTHNAYLALFVYTGILGGGLMCAWLIWIVFDVFRYLVRRWDSKDDYYWPVFICTGILLIEAVSSSTLVGLFFCNQVVDIIFWLVLGYTLCFLRQSEPDRFYRKSCCSRIFGKLSLQKLRKNGR